MILLRSTKWLSDEEFRELLKIADYRGHENNKSVFAFNIEKALKNKYSYEDAVLLIQELGLEVDSSALEEMRKQYSRAALSIEWNSSNGLIRVRVPWSSYYSVRDLLRKRRAKYHGKSETDIVYCIAPNEAHEFASEVGSVGLSVVDRERLLEDKVLPFKLSLRNVALRDYQRESINKWIENKYRGIVALPTGSGKTVIGIAAIAEKPVRTLIVTYTREQMFQWRDMLLKYTDAEPKHVGLMYSEEKRIAPITITTYQSGFRIINEVSPYFSLLIVDEVHHLPADKFRHIAVHSLARYRMGLSATPEREDGKHEELFPLLGGIIYYKTPAELSRQGYLAKYKIYTIKVDLTPEEKKLLEELRKKYRALAGFSDFQELLDAAKRGNEKAAEALKVHSKMRLLMANSKSKVERAVEIANKEYESGNKIIVFTQYVDQANEISKRLNAYLLTGEVPVEARRVVLEKFKRSDRGILVVTTVGDEGLDIPDANVGIIVSGTGSRRQFIQRLGRLLRPKKGDVEARLYEIVSARTPEEYYAKRRKSLDLEVDDHSL